MTQTANFIVISVDEVNITFEVDGSAAPRHDAHDVHENEEGGKVKEIFEYEPSIRCLLLTSSVVYVLESTLFTLIQTTLVSYRRLLIF